MDYGKSADTKPGSPQEKVRQDGIAQKTLKTALREIKIFSDLSEEEIDWLASHTEEHRYKPGEPLYREGQAADRMTIILEGEAHFRRPGEDAPVYIASAGMVTGKLPFSRMKRFNFSGQAVHPMWVAMIYTKDFPEMLRVIPVLGERLVAVMSDRIREVTRADLQREKLVSLGKLSAGLAHELNNPSAAASRAAQNLRESMHNLRSASLRLLQRNVTPSQLAALAGFESKLEEQQRTGKSYLNDPLKQSDREEEVVALLEKLGVSEPWKLAPTLAELCVDGKQLEAWSQKTGKDLLGDFLMRIVSYLTVTHLVDEIEASVGRISHLVKAVKEYSYMDKPELQEVDVNQGIENTLVILAHRLKNGITVVRDYDKDLPKICAHGGELNQVWTNLIDNAIDAMQGKGELRIRTMPENGCVMVEIADNGPGIPEDLQNKIFDPFFTTKPVGEGTGLGLDIVNRVVRAHHGDVRLISHPGSTRFQIRLPINQPRTVPEPEENSDAEMHTS